MQTLYDTRTVHPLDRYDYYRAQAAATELAPVAASGKSPRELLAVMRIARVGEFTIETVTWAPTRR